MMINQQFDFLGVFLPTLGLMALFSLVATNLLRRGLARVGFYRWVWHRPLFDVALYVSILGVCALIFQQVAS